MSQKYEFPLTNPFKAREVTELDFDIAPYTDELYVDLDRVRGRDYEDKMLFQLGVNRETNILEEYNDEYTKTIFSGHMGSGKTLELRRFQKYINHKDRYLSVFIELEKTFEVARFQSEDFFVMLFTELAKVLAANEIPFPEKALENLQKDWLSETEIEEINSSNWGISAEVEHGFKANIFLLFSAKIKGLFASDNKVSTKIREKVKKNSATYIKQFNEILFEIRQQLQYYAVGKDILFIIDGSEKLRKEVYKEIFVDNSYLWRDIETNIICSVPISMHYELQNKPAMDFYQSYLLPMIKITETNKPILKEIITHRIDKDTFFPDEEALDLAIRYSGGSIRQLLKIVNAMLRYTTEKPITPESAKVTIKELGRKMWETLTTKQVNILKQGAAIQDGFKPADDEVALLVFSLVLMKYNGNVKINPLLDEYFQGQTLLSIR
jgi:hypothetical protein